MSYTLLAIYFATSHFRKKKTTPCSLRMRKNPLTKGLSKFGRGKEKARETTTGVDGRHQRLDWPKCSSR